MAEDNDNIEFDRAKGCPPDVLSPDAQPLCHNCLAPCDRLQYYCHNCDSTEPINPLAAYIPFVRLRFHYGIFCNMWRMLWYGEVITLTCRLAFVLFIFLFAPIMFVLGLPLLLLIKSARPTIPAKLAVTLISITILLTVVRLFAWMGLSFYTY